MLKLKNVSKYYYQDGVISKGISKVNLELFIGEFIVITGESGSGKSTLLNVLSGLDSYEDGEMYINGEETSHYTETDYQRYRRQYVSNIFQNFNLVNSYTVYENIELAMLMNGKNRINVRKRVNELIDKVGLKKFKNTKASKLSGGQKQRVAIARALANDTPIIVADEPTGSLDSTSSKSILKLLKEISNDKLVVVVTHNKKEIEEYATRLIRMHDGTVLEDKSINKINLDGEIKVNEVKEITCFSKLWLSFKNAFNIPVQLILMIIIFLLISITLITNYGSLKVAEYSESETAYNQYFLNNSDKRIVLKKNDLSLFTKDDYNNLSKLDEVDYLVENDLLNDIEINIFNDYVYMYGKLNLKKIDKVDVGRIPTAENEIVIGGSKDNYYLTDLKDNIINQSFSTSESDIKTVKVVGIIYSDINNDYNYDYYFNDKLLNTLGEILYSRYATTSILFNDYLSNEVIVKIDDSVNIGEIKISDNYRNQCEYENCINKNLELKVKNIYYEESLNFKVTKLYTKKDKEYEEYSNNVYINSADYSKLYHGNYQSSLFLKDTKDLDKILEALEKMNYSVLSLRNAKTDDLQEFVQIFKIFKLILTIILIISLFLISYFIIKIIYKSRNSYYTTLRSLGCTKKSCVTILRNELFIIASFTYFFLIIMIYLVNKNIVNFEYLKNISHYITVIDYIIIYFILIILSYLISNRYGRKIFKDSIMKTYGEKQI